jgi:SAM-dependent methyltransferase
MEKAYARKLAQLEKFRWWNVARRRIIVHVLKTFYGAASGDILEIGCGAGANFEALSDFGQLFAVEPDAELLRLARKKNLAQAVEKGSLPDALPFIGRRFDVILLLDVLEHVENESSAIKAVLQRLKPGGKVLVTVPAYRFLWSEIDIDSRHFRRYRRRELLHKLQFDGFNVIYSTYFNTILFPPILAVRIFNKILGVNDRLDLHLPKHGINTLLTDIFATERFLMPWISFPFGVSILAMAQKRD